MILSLPKPDGPKVLVACLLFLPLLLGILVDFLGLPGALRYGADMAWCALALLAAGRGRLRFSRQLGPMACAVAGFFLYTLLLFVVRYRSAVWYLWGLRNYFRFYAAFFAFGVCLKEADAQRCFSVLEGLFWVDIAVSFWQFFVMDLRQDYLGGIFGVARGRNGTYTLIFFCVLLTRSLLAMLDGRESVLHCACKCTAALMVAAMAEMFGFFLFFGLIALLSALLTGPSRRKVGMFLAMGLGTVLFSALLLRLFGEGSRLTLEVIRNRLFAPHYATDSDLGRLTAIPTLSRTILTQPADRLFGLGLGNCDTSTFALCNSDFYQQYSHLHYTWFLSAFLFLETGFVGLGWYLLFFLLCLLGAVRRLKQGGNVLHCRMGVVLSVVCMVLTVYNSALRAEGGYLMYFALALPFLSAGDSRKGGEP